MAYASQQWTKNLIGQTLKTAKEEGLLGGGGQEIDLSIYATKEDLNTLIGEEVDETLDTIKELSEAVKENKNLIDNIPTSENKEILDKLSESNDGNLLFNGKEISNSIKAESLNAYTKAIKRWLRFDPDNKKGLIVKLGTGIVLSNGTTKYFSEDTKIDLTDYITEPGKDYFVYIDDNENIIASSSKQSTGVQIGRFHTLCVNAGVMTMIAPASPSSGLVIENKYLVKTYKKDEDPDFYEFYNKNITAVTKQTYYDVVTCEHPLSGFMAGDILPESVFCLDWQPDCLYEDGMVYDKDIDKCVDIYLQSGTGHNTRSIYGAVHTNNRQSINHWTDFRMVGKEPLDDFEFTSAALGSNEKTSIIGSKDQTTVGGHVNTANRRMISAIGCEEMCGYLWQWLKETGFNGQTNWKTTDGHASFGQEYGEPYVLLAGGDSNCGSSCGSRCRISGRVRSGVAAGGGGRGSSRIKYNKNLIDNILTPENKEILNKLSESDDGNLLFDDKEIKPNTENCATKDEVSALKESLKNILTNLTRNLSPEENKSMALKELLAIDPDSVPVALEVNGLVTDDLTAVANSSTEPVSIKLLKDCEPVNGLRVEEGHEVELDLNGHTLLIPGNVDSSGTQTNGFQFLKDSDITIKNGILQSDSAKILVQNYSNLTLDNVLLKGSGKNIYLCSNNYGNVVFKNGTTFDCNPGCVAFDCYYGMNKYGYYDSGVTVTIADDSVKIINGKYEYDHASRITDMNQFYENAKIIIPENYELEPLDGYEWTPYGDGMKSLTKIAE